MYDLGIASKKWVFELIRCKSRRSNDSSTVLISELEMCLDKNYVLYTRKIDFGTARCRTLPDVALHNVLCESAQLKRAICSVGAQIRLHNALC